MLTGYFQCNMQEHKNDFENIKKLKEKISKLKSFSIALDESTDASDTAQLAEQLPERMYLKQSTQSSNNLGLNGVHCLAYALTRHLQLLVSKRNVMEVVVGCINFIKPRALIHRQFKEYLEDIFSEYDDVSYDTEIRGKNCFHIPTLAAHTNIPFDFYGDELNSLIDQFDMRFIDFQNKDLTFTVFARPMDVVINCVPE
ncbi:hypothetical protein RF11_07306 [Thelohanellus kitauei]|uniref:Zinc finger BED domain-containing protein 5 n=1 Tax=Thelohanellus kitauei TaxID=669202 RepID=A0A0C2JEZ8_THEKT|nr:hypothetical protein RF11_07306 [Thelohanellus kitauei]